MACNRWTILRTSSIRSARAVSRRKGLRDCTARTFREGNER
jgi:hypothetical protein